MAFNDWDIWFPSPAFGAQLTTSNVIVGGKSLLLYGANAVDFQTPPRKEYLWAVPDSAHNVRQTFRGRIRTLVRVLESLGTGRQQVGLVCLTHGYSAKNHNHPACYGLLLDGPQNLVAWERVILVCFAGQHISSGDVFRTESYMTVLDEAPFTGSPASVTSLELTWYAWTFDDYDPVRLIGKVGTATNYSDLTVRVETMLTDYPALAQNTGNEVDGQGRSGLLVLYNSVTATPGHKITVAFDETNLDEYVPVATRAMRGPGQKYQRARKYQRQEEMVR